MITYIARNTFNGKFYIGSTTNLEKRKKNHLQSNKNYPFQNALRANPEAFEWEHWEDESEEPILEQALLDMFFGKGMCYNLNPSASIPPSAKGLKRSAEHIARIKETKRGDNNPAKRPEVRAKNAVAQRGKKQSAETIAKRMKKIRENGGASRGGIASARIKVQCTVTGHISTPGPLSIFQRKRGIDTSNRIRLN